MVSVFGTVFTMESRPARVTPPQQVRCNRCMFDSPTLEDGLHKLTITTVNGSKTIFDYLGFTPSQPSSSPSLTASNSPITHHSGQQPLPIGAVAGISVAATVVAISILGCLLWWWQHRRHERSVRPSGQSTESTLTSDQWFK